MNTVQLIGRLTKVPELRYLPGGNNTAVAKFTLAVDRAMSREQRQEAESKSQPTADFINITVWGKQAEHVNNYLDKGSKAAVTGRIQTGSYEKDGKRYYTTEVVADRVEFLDPPQKDRQAAPQTAQGTIDDIEGFYTVDNEDIPF